MRIDFPYPGYQAIAPVEVPDANLMGVFTPRSFAVDEEAVLRQGFERPIGAARLRDAVRAGHRVLVLIDDATRVTPIAQILPHVLEELHAGGVADERIELLQAPG